MQNQWAELRSATQATRSPQRRMLTIGIVGALHIAIIYALVSGTMGTVIRTISDPIVLAPLREPAPPKDPIEVKNIEKDFVMPKVADPDVPVWTDQSENTITVVRGDPDKKVVVPPNPPTPAQGIMNTHTIPTYPSLAIRMHQQGTVTLLMEVAADGSVSAAQVEVSSGSTYLDDAAVEWVKAHWRYKPATKDGVAIASTTRANVRFNLKDAR